MSKVSLLNIKPSNHIPELYRDSLKFCFDPYRQQRAGWTNAKFNPVVIDYSSFLKGKSILAANASNYGALFEYTYQAVTNNIGKFTRTGSTNPHISFISGVNGIDLTKTYFISYEAYSPTSTAIPVIGTFNQHFTGNPGVSLSPTWKRFNFVTKPQGTIYLYLLSTLSSEIYIRNMVVIPLVDGSIGTSNVGDLHKTGWGVHPGAMLFDGVNDYVDFKEIDSIGSNDFIFCSWVKYNSLITNKSIVGARRPDSNNYSAITITPNYISDNVRFFISNNGISPTLDERIPIDGLSLGWHLLTITKMSTNYEVYMDAVSIGSGNNAPSSIDRDTAGWVLGCTEYAGSLTGFYDDQIGITKLYTFTSMPTDYETPISKIFEAQRSIYGV